MPIIVENAPIGFLGAAAYRGGQEDARQQQIAEMLRLQQEARAQQEHSQAMQSRQAELNAFTSDFRQRRLQERADQTYLSGGINAAGIPGLSATGQESPETLRLGFPGIVGSQLQQQQIKAKGDAVRQRLMGSAQTGRLSPQVAMQIGQAADLDPDQAERMLFDAEDRAMKVEALSPLLEELINDEQNPIPRKDAKVIIEGYRNGELELWQVMQRFKQLADFQMEAKTAAFERAEEENRQREAMAAIQSNPFLSAREKSVGALRMQTDVPFDVQGAEGERAPSLPAGVKLLGRDPDGSFQFQTPNGGTMNVAPEIAADPWRLRDMFVTTGFALPSSAPRQPSQEPTQGDTPEDIAVAQAIRNLQSEGKPLTREAVKAEAARIMGGP